METITDLLLDQDNQTPALLQILSSSIQWIFMTLVITAMAIYTLPYLQNYTEGYVLFFDYVIFIKTWWPHTLGLCACAMILYHWCCYRLTGPGPCNSDGLRIFPGICHVNRTTVPENQQRTDLLPPAP